jgi:hypothetical protein
MKTEWIILLTAAGILAVVTFASLFAVIRALRLLKRG